ncbi:MAG TPA: hypothetical protein VHX68_06955, partial [Planctomycetaceae bacterium]|nr:hypothetical protein [Planctomycetaceae bacterium]
MATARYFIGQSVCADDQRERSRAGWAAGERQIRSGDRSGGVLKRLDLPQGFAPFDDRERDWRDRLNRQESTSKEMFAVRRLRWQSAVSCTIGRGVGVAMVAIARVAIGGTPKSLGF